MKKICDSESGVLNGRLLLAFSLCSIGALLGIVSFAQVPTICVNCGGNPNAFLVRSYQGTTRCLDYTPEQVGSPIFINDCKVAHQIVVEEINARHDVLLHAGTKVIGARGGNSVTHTRGGASSPAGPGNAEFALVLQNPPNQAASHSRRGADQRFALDGDSIILSSSMSEPPTNSNPVLVAKVKNARGAIGTPVVLGPRNLADNEFWDFSPTNGIDHDPTSGFKRVSTRDELLIAMYQINQIATQNSMETGLPNGAAWGSVIRIIDTREPIDLSPNPAYIDYSSSSYQSEPRNIPAASHNLVIPKGVTIRGDRRGTNPGPLLLGKYNNTTLPLDPGFDQEDHMFEIQGDYVRITGLRLQGPLDPSKSNQPLAVGIATGDHPYQCNWHPGPFTRTIIDHNDLSHWTSAAIVQISGYCPPKVGPPGLAPVAPVGSVRAERNFIHDTEWGEGSGKLGYGVNVFGATILGNTFLTNRHAITAGGGCVTSYSAFYNLVLSRTLLSRPQQIFDVHGTNNPPAFDGGFAGNQVEIEWNTFLGGNRDNFDLRGQPCFVVDSFANNVSMRDNADAVRVWGRDATDDGDGFYVTTTYVWPVPSRFGVPTSSLEIAGNHFSVADPTNRLGVGDFDGDGVQDLFLATGAAWYHSPGGKGEWRLLSGGRTDKIQSLLLGDFDGDGRTDVVAIHGGQFVVSWGGVSDWEVLNPNPAGGIFFVPSAATTMAVGDFDGDGISDIFYADGQTWWVSYGGNTPFILVATSSFRVKDLRFGDFDGNGTTDVFGVGSVNWQVSCSPKGVRGVFASWQPLQKKLTDTAQGLVVADFNGDGFADVAANCEDPGCWRISYGGFQDWYYVSQPYGIVGPHVAGYGHFIGHVEADVLAWNINISPPSYNPIGACDPEGPSDVLCISVGGFYPLQRQSRQEMR